MAGGSISVKSKASAQEWVSTANQLNQEANDLNTMVANVLKMIESDSEGDLAVRLIQAGNSMMQAATEIMSVMEDIAKNITSVVDSISEVVDGVIGKVVSFITG